MSIESIPRVGLSEVIVEKLRQDIMSGRIKPGDRLPPHEQLCRRWSVSRVTVREALHKLEALGFVEMHQGRGTFIRKPDRPALEQHLGFHLVPDHRTVKQLLESRRVIETSLAGFAAERGSEEDHRKLAALMQEMEAAGAQEDSLAYAAADFKFHMTVARAAQNDILLLLLEKIQNLVQTQQQNIYAYESAQGIRMADFSIPDHREILRLIRLRDAAGAAARMREHISRVEQMIESYYRSRSGKHE